MLEGRADDRFGIGLEPRTRIPPTRPSLEEFQHVPRNRNRDVRRASARPWELVAEFSGIAKYTEGSEARVVDGEGV